MIPSAEELVGMNSLIRPWVDLGYVCVHGERGVTVLT